MKNNLSRGIRKASDFLMALQLTGAYKKSSLANLHVQLPAVVIGGGLTAIDTATELLAYYPVQLEKVAARIHALTEEKGADAVRAMFDQEEWEQLQVQLQHAKELEEERDLAAREGRDPRLQPLLDRWGGVTLVYRRSVLESPAYRLNHEEVQKSLEEGVRYVEGLALTGAWIDEEKGLLGTIVLEMGGSSRLCAALRPDEPIILMGPTGTPTEIMNETVMLVGGGLGNAVLFSIARASRPWARRSSTSPATKRARTSSSRTTSRRTPIK